MTTTACDDQFSAEPEPVHQPYDVAAILRKNIADLEKELQRQREQNAAATERLREQIERVTSEWERAENDVAAARSDLQSFIDSRNELMARAEAAEAELAKMREQKPALYMAFSECGQFIRYWTRDTANLDATMAVNDFTVLEFFARPTPATAVPDWNVNIERIRDVMHMLGISIEESVECFSAALPTNINRMTLAMKRHLQELAGMTAATAPSVPDEWREVMTELAADVQAACDAEHPHRDQYPSVMRKYNNDMEIIEKARALLQSADHSERNLEKVAPDCRNCANRVKRRCEACAILPCSCK